MARRAESLLEEELGLQFNDKALLRCALTHTSFIHEHPESGVESNERLEFLGDALVGFVIGEDLFRRFPEMPEGGLTTHRASLVRSETLAEIGTSMDLGDYLYLGRGEELSGGRTRERNLARGFEALCGAVLLDLGFAEARALVLAWFEDRLESLPDEAAIDYKSLLQEAVQALGVGPPQYRTVSSVGPDHSKDFTVEVVVGSEVLGEGSGPSKRKAQQDAAQDALEAIEKEGVALGPPPG